MKRRGLLLTLALSISIGSANADMQTLTDDDLQSVTGQNDLNQNFRPKFESLTLEQIQESDRFQNLSEDQQTFLTDNFESLQAMPHDERIQTLSAQGFPSPDRNGPPDFSTLTIDDVTSSRLFQNLSEDQQEFMTDNFDSLQSMSHEERRETLQAQGFPEPPHGGGRPR